MDYNFGDLIEALKRKENMIYVTEHIMKDLFSKPADTYEDAEIIYQKMLKDVLRETIDIIFQNAESEIETVFLESVK